MFGRAGNTGENSFMQGNTALYRGIQLYAGEYRRIQGNTGEIKQYSKMKWKMCIELVKERQ